MVELKIESLLEGKFLEEEFSDCFLIDIQLSKNNKLVVFIDSDTGVTFEKCRKISRYLEEKIDAEGWLGEKYILEVSSPGVDRPLKYHRQYYKNIGRKVEVTLREGKVKEGVLEKVTKNNVILKEKKKGKSSGKKKSTGGNIVEIPFDQIEKTVVKVSF